MLKPNSEGRKGLTYMGWNRVFQAETSSSKAQRQQGRSWKMGGGGENVKASWAQRTSKDTQVRLEDGLGSPEGDQSGCRQQYGEIGESQEDHTKAVLEH